MNPIPERAPRFRALLPFFVFVIFYVGLSIEARDFYKVPMPAAFLVASAFALPQDHKRKLADKVELYAQGMGEPTIMVMVLIFILSGAFAAAAKAMGAVDAAVLIAEKLVPGRLMLCGIFLLSCLISLAMGTSCGTIAPVAPIALGLAHSLQINPALMLGSVVGGAMFGDNLSMISDTTIAATRMMKVEMRDKFFINIRLILPALIGTLLLYFFQPNPVGASLPAAEALQPIHFVRVLPYLLILICAMCGFNVMGLLFCSCLFACFLGIWSGSFTLWGALDAVGKGTLGMSETLIVAILAGGLLSTIRHNGGIRYLIQLLERFIRGPRACELGIALLVSLVNLFTANNTIAIVITGPIAADLSAKFHCNPRRIAGILDTASCAVQGIIPYGAQVLIAVGVASSIGMAVSSLDLLRSLYYPQLLFPALLLSILFHGRGEK